MKRERERERESDRDRENDVSQQRLFKIPQIPPCHAIHSAAKRTATCVTSGRERERDYNERYAFGHAGNFPHNLGK